MGNAHAALQFATQALKLPLERVKLFGRSIGTGPALALASQFNVSGVILVTPFISVRALFREKVGLLSMMIEEWFSNEDAIRQVRSPTLIIHGRKDALIPCAHGEALFHICSSRKLFINPQLMEHNTNLTSDISFLIVPMFRFFALPDYTFQELKVPAWAFDKRRSPLYMRPEVQVVSHTAAVVLSADQGAAGTISVPAGDDAEDQPSTKDLESAPHKAVGNADPADYAKMVGEKMTVLTQPTVLHSYSATKQRYRFKDTNGCGQRVPNKLDENKQSLHDPDSTLEQSEEVPLEETLQALRPRLSAQRPIFETQTERRTPVGRRESASKAAPQRPPGTGVRTFVRQHARGASTGTAYGEHKATPNYDGEQPRPPQESPGFAPSLSQRPPTDDDLDDEIMQEPRGPRVAPKQEPLEAPLTSRRPEPSCQPHHDVKAGGTRAPD